MRKYNIHSRVRRTPLQLNADAEPFKAVSSLGSYWNNKSPLGNELEDMFAKLVPLMGEAETVHGELVRAINRIYYRAYNDGVRGMIDFDDEDEDEDSHWLYRDEWDYLEAWFDEYYGELLFFIEKYIPEQHVECVRQVKRYALERNELYDLPELDELADRVVHTIKNTEDMPYKKEDPLFWEE